MSKFDERDPGSQMLGAFHASITKRSEGAYKNILPSTYSLYLAAKKRNFKRKILTSLVSMLYPCSLRDKKYIFIGLRYKDLLECLHKDDVFIVATSFFEVKYAIANKIAFIPSAEISHCFLQAYFEHQYNRLDRLIATYEKLLAEIETACWLILTSDTKPVDIFFSILSRLYTSKSRIMCLQHGIFPDVDPNIYVAEGESIPINILYDETQKVFASKYIKSSEFYVMGPFWNLPHVDEKGVLEVVLLGSGGGDSIPTLYEASIEIFKIFSNELKLRKVPHVYRPHPTELKSYINNIFDVIDFRSKLALLSGAPKLFIGFNSTLMYEAYLCGHSVYAIKPSLFSCPTFDIDDFISMEAVQEFCLILERMSFLRKKIRSDGFSGCLSERFKSILKKIETLS